MVMGFEVPGGLTLALTAIAVKNPPRPPTSHTVHCHGGGPGPQMSSERPASPVIVDPRQTPGAWKVTRTALTDVFRRTDLLGRIRLTRRTVTVIVPLDGTRGSASLSLTLKPT